MCSLCNRIYHILPDYLTYDYDYDDHVCWLFASCCVIEKKKRAKTQREHPVGPRSLLLRKDALNRKYKMRGILEPTCSADLQMIMGRHGNNKNDSDD